MEGSEMEKNAAPTLSKGTVALTFKFDCDRFLRYRLATKAEREHHNLPRSDEGKKRRPGIQLVADQGHLWEAKCYDDVVELAAQQVLFRKSTQKDPNLRILRYETVEEVELAKRLAGDEPPAYIIEGTFKIPLEQATFPGLLDFVRDHPGRLEGAYGRPDLLWVQPFDGQVELLPGSPEKPEFVIHIFDVKLAAEPSLRHFVEVTYYAFGLQAWLRAHPKLSKRYAVAAAGRVWPGTHDPHAFRNLVREKEARGSSNPMRDALLEMTEPVPHEAYWPRVREFLDEKVPAVVGMEPHAAQWHVSSKCQLCDYAYHCTEEALPAAKDHLSQLPGITAGQVRLMQREGIATLSELREEFRGSAPRWENLKKENQRFRAEEAALRARVEALSSNQLIPVSSRRTTLMPAFANRRIFLTTHFDPGTGLSFAFGAKSVYFPPGHAKGTPPIEERHQFIVDSLPTGEATDSEKQAFLDLCRVVKAWLLEVDALCQAAKARKAPRNEFASVQMYLWDPIEAKQFGRVLMRHLEDPKVLEEAEFFVRFFPAEKDLRDPDVTKQTPVTVVKPVVKQLLALPEPFDYSLWRTRFWLKPIVNKETGELIYARPRYGFFWPMTDQIPFERAYELWHRRIMLTHPDRDGVKGRPYSRDELRLELQRTVENYCNTLADVVTSMGQRIKDRLLLRKEGFFLSSTAPLANLPMQSRAMLTHAKLNAIAQELENKELLAKPIEEREATFNCIRGLVRTDSERAMKLLRDAQADPRYSTSELMAFRFNETSRDTRLSAGDFMVLMRNESSTFNIDDMWYRAIGVSTWAEAEQLPIWPADEQLQRSRLKSLLQVTIVRLDTVGVEPIVVVAAERGNLRLARNAGLLNLAETLVLDPLTRDFSTAQLEATLKAVGGGKNGKPAGKSASRTSSTVAGAR
jgi:hypothetical protein